MAVDSNEFNKILLFTDGACSGNPGPGGYGVVIVLPGGQIMELGAGFDSTTNNKMELTAALVGINRLQHVQGDLWILTDSTYVIRGITSWVWGWMKRGWKNSAGETVINKELWQDLAAAVRERKKMGSIEWKYVRGHTGVPGNERCDEIAVAYTRKKHITLYKGNLRNYKLPIYDLPDEMSLPPMKEVREKKSAYSYLSYVNGQLKRHRNWGECEAVVKGRSGAKFKKTESPENELEIIASWGLSVDDFCDGD